MSGLAPGRPLPPGWRWVKLGEVCEQDRSIVEPRSTEAVRLPYLGLEDIESDSGRVLKREAAPPAEEGISTTFRFDRRHVLYGKLRPYLNKVALPDFEGRCTTEMIPLLPMQCADRGFLAWLLRREETVDFAMREKTGARMPRANMDVLLAMSIPLPPLPEQRRIAGILNEQMQEVEKARKATEAQLEAARAMPAAYLREVFDSEEAKKWPKKKLGDLGLETSNGVYKPDEYYGSGVPIMKMYNIGRLDGAWNLARVDRIRLSREEVAQYALAAGDILLNRVNSRELVGKCAVVRGAVAGAVFESKNMRVRLDSGRADPNFVVAYLNGDQGRAQISGLLKQIVGMATVNRDDVESLSLPIPQIEQQRRISGTLSTQMAGTDNQRAVLEAQLETTNKLPAALLRKAFNGEL